MEQAMRENFPQKLLDGIGEETWRFIRLHDAEHGQDGKLTLSKYALQAVKMIAYPFMIDKPIYALLTATEMKSFDTILQGAIWTGYLICQDEMKGRTA